MKRWIAGCFVASCCAPSCSESSPEELRPNLVLIVMDTVRRDHLSCYGYERDTTPFLEELAATSIVYESAHSTSGWTSPAHASLFTGLFPVAHRTTQEYWVLGDQWTTLAERLADAGFETTGIVENPMLSARNGFDQGFAAYHEAWRSEAPDGESALAFFRDSIANRDNSKPFFTFFNLMGAHSPYRAPKEFSLPFVQDRSITLRSNLWREFFLGSAVFTEAELEHLRDLYDGELRYTDHLVREIAEELKRAGLWENTVFVVTSDHGENLGDHRMMDHVFSLYESTTAIPLLIHDPVHFAPGSRESRAVQLPDVYSTLLERAGLDSEGSQGINLLQLKGERPVLCEYYFPLQAFRALGEKAAKAERLNPYRRRLRSIQRGHFKLIWGSDDRHELYNLELDPREEQNLASEPESAATLAELQELLRVELARLAVEGSPSAPLETPDSETLRELRKIGYAK